MRFFLLSLVGLLYLAEAGYGRGELGIKMRSRDGRVSYSLGVFEDVSASELIRVMKKVNGAPNAYPVGIYPSKEITFTNVFQLITLLRSIGWSNIAVFAENGEAISNDRLGYFQIDGREVYDFKRRDRSKKGEKR